jgi:hypothetical protein
MHVVSFVSKANASLDRTHEPRLHFFCFGVVVESFVSLPWDRLRLSPSAGRLDPRESHPGRPLTNKE